MVHKILCFLLCKPPWVGRQRKTRNILLDQSGFRQCAESMHRVDGVYRGASLYKMDLNICSYPQMNFARHTEDPVLDRRERDVTQAEAARAKTATPSAVARLEKQPVQARNGIFPDAEAAIAAAVHSSACEGRTVPSNEIEDLRRVVRGEISREELIKKYVDEALAEQEARDRGYG